MADKLPCKSLKISEKNKLINALQANEDVRSGESEKVVNSSHNMSSVSASAVNAAQSKKKTSFQITSVTVGSSRLSNDGGDDSADDLDESHTDDISRVTDNETPSISEDTFSKDEMCYNASVGSILTSAPVIPTSAQYGLAIVPESSGVGDVDGNRDVEMAGNDGDDGPTKSPPLSHKDNSPEPLPAQPVRHERFKVVKIESDVPFRRGRWICMDYLDHSIHMPTSSPWPNCCPWASPRPSVTPTAQPATPAPVPQTQTRPQTQSQFSQQSVSPSQAMQKPSAVQEQPVIKSSIGKRHKFTVSPVKDDPIKNHNNNTVHINFTSAVPKVTTIFEDSENEILQENNKILSNQPNSTPPKVNQLMTNQQPMMNRNNSNQNNFLPILTNSQVKTSNNIPMQPILTQGSNGQQNFQPIVAKPQENPIMIQQQNIQPVVQSQWNNNVVSQNYQQISTIPQQVDVKNQHQNVIPQQNLQPNIQQNLQPNVQQNVQPIIQQNLQSNIQQNAQPNIQQNVQPNIQQNLQPNIQQNLQPNIQQNVQPNIQQNLQPNIQQNLQPNIQQNLQPNIQQNVQPNIQQNLQPNIQQNLQPNIQQNVQPNIQQNLQPNIQQNLQPNIQQNLQPNIQQNVQPNIQQNLQPNVQQNVQPIIQQNFQPNIQQNVQPNIQQNVQPIIQQNVQPNIQNVQQYVQPNLQQYAQPNYQQNVQQYAQPLQQNQQSNVQQNTQPIPIQQNGFQYAQPNLQQNMQQYVQPNIQNVQPNLYQNTQPNAYQNVQSNLQPNISPKMKPISEEIVQPNLQQYQQSNVRQNMQQNLQQHLQQIFQPTVQQNLQSNMQQIFQPNLQPNNQATYSPPQQVIKQVNTLQDYWQPTVTTGYCAQPTYQQPNLLSQTRQTSVNPQYQQTQTTQGNFTQASFQPSTATSQAYAQTYTSIPSTQSTQSSQPIMSQQSQPTNQQPYMVNQQQQQTQSQPASQQSAQSQSQVGYQGQQFLQNTGSVGRFTPQLSSTSVAPIQPSQSYPNTSTRQQNVISGQTYAGMPSQNEQQQQQPGQTSVYVVYQYQSPTKTTVTPTTYCAQTTTTGVFLQSSASAVSQPLVQQQFTSAGSKLPLAQYPNSTSAIKYTPTVAVSPTIDSKSIMTAVESQSQANVIVSVQTPNSVTTAAVTAAEDESASAASPVAIDNKIEQAMDLVKSHLMFAVREEVEVLKEKIAELMDRINQLELENTFLKAHVPAEILMQLTNNQIPEGQSAKPVFQSAVNNGNGAS